MTNLVARRYEDASAKLVADIAFLGGSFCYLSVRIDVGKGGHDGVMLLCRPISCKKRFPQ